MGKELATQADWIPNAHSQVSMMVNYEPSDARWWQEDLHPAGQLVNALSMGAPGSARDPATVKKLETPVLPSALCTQ